MTTGKTIHTLRKQLKLTQEELGAKIGVSGVTVGYWEKDEHTPRGNNLISLAKALGLEPSELMNPAQGATAIRETTARYTGAKSLKKVPLISWVVAGEWCESPDNFAPGDAEEWLDTPFSVSSRAYCLTLSGDSMSPDYREGEIILVDPGIAPLHGNDIVARTPDGKQTFKRLQITPEGTYLLALNPDHPNRKIEIPEGTTICGVVVGSWMRRR